MPIQILNATAHVSGNVTSPNNALGAVNNVWTGNVDNESWASRWRLAPAPDGTVDVAQSLTIRARKQTGFGSPSMTVDLYVNNALKGRVATADVTSLTGQDVVVPFNLTDRDGNDVSFLIDCIAVGGSPSNRASIQIDAFVWSCSYAEFEGSALKGWDGGSWVDGLLKKWDGGAWVPARIQRWSGSGWVNVP